MIKIRSLDKYDEVIRKLQGWKMRGIIVEALVEGRT
jgi:hypothetical protein